MNQHTLPSYLLLFYQLDFLLSFYNIQHRIQFQITDDHEILFHTISNSTHTTFHFYGGMESLMIDLALKITFARFAFCPVCDFFIIDENLFEEEIVNIENQNSKEILELEYEIENLEIS